MHFGRPFSRGCVWPSNYAAELFDHYQGGSTNLVRALLVHFAQPAHAPDVGVASAHVYLSVILLGGLVLNATLGWRWADPFAALVMVPIIAREGLDGVRGRSCCATCAPTAPANS